MMDSQYRTKILVVDDDPSICRTMEMILQAKGYDVETVQEGNKAIRCVREVEFDVAILDIRLPDMDGTDLLREVLIIRPIMNCIMITGYASVESVVHALNSGASAYITKPLNMDEVLRIIDTAVSKQLQIRESKFVRTAIQESEEKFRGLFEQSSVALELYDSEGQLIDANQATLNLFGVPDIEEVIGFKLFEDPNISEELKKELRKGKSVKYEAEFDFERVKQLKLYKTSKSGVVFLDVMISPLILGTDDKDRVFLVQIRDITENRRAQDELRESEERHRLVLSSLNDLVFVIDKNSNYTEFYASDTVSPHVSPEVFLGKNIMEIMPPELATRIIESSNRVRETGDRETLEYSLAIEDQETWYNATLDLHQDGESVVLVARDITTRKKAEEAQRFERERWADVFDALDDGIYIVDQNYDIEYTNQVIGREFGPIEGRKCYAYFNDRKEPCPWCKNEVVFAGKSVRWEWYSEKNDRHYQLLDVPMRNADGSVSKLEVFHDVTEAKRTEEALRRSEEKHRAMTDGSPFVMIVFGEGGVLHMNEAFEKISTYSNEDMMNFSLEDIFKLVHPDDVEYLIETAQRYFAGDEEGSSQFRVFDAEGNILWVQAYARSLDFEGEQAFQLTLFDITESKEAEEALQASEERFRLLLETIPDPLYVIDQETGRILYVNDAAVEMYGYSRDEWLQMVNTDVSAEPEETAKATSEVPPLIPIRYHKKKDGTIFPLEITVSEVILSGRQVVIATARDISERIEVEEILRASEEKYRSLFENMLDGYAYCRIITDKKNQPIDFTYIEINSAFERLTGLKREDVVGKRATEAIPTIMEDNPELFDIYGKVALTGEATEFEIYFKPLDIWLSLSVFSPKREYFVAVFDNITERKHTESVIRGSEERYRLLYHNLSDALVRTDTEGFITFCNAQAAEMFQYAHEEFIGVHFSELLHPDEREIMAKEFAYSLEIGKANLQGFEVKGIRKDESVFYLHIKNVVITRDGKYTGYQCLIRDITTLKENEDRFKLVIQSMNDLIFVYDKANRYSKCFALDKSLLYLPEEEFIGKLPSEVLPEDVSDSIIECIIKTRETGTTQNIHYPLIIGGVEQWFSASHGIHPDGESVVAVARCITDRKTAEMALKESEEKYSSLFHNSFNGLAFHKLELDEKGNPVDYIFLEVNDAFERMTGLKRENVIGKKVTEVIPGIGDSDLDWIGIFGRATLTGEPIVFESYFKEFDRWYSVSAYCPIEGYFVSVFRDITELHRQQKDLSRQLEEKEILLRELHHRIKNNLQVISSLLYLQSKTEDDETVRAALMQGQSRIRTMTLIHELLYESQALSTVNMMLYIRSLLDVLYESFGVSRKRVKLELEVEDIEMSIDKAIPCGLIINEIVSNSLKYAFPDESRGVISIRLEVNSDGGIVLTIGDNGVGMPDDFDPEEAKTLGLRVVKAMAETQLQGRLELDRSNGTWFTISFQRDSESETKGGNEP